MAQTDMREIEEQPNTLETPDDKPVLRLKIWPHRSLAPKTLRWIMLATVIGFAVPMLAIYGTVAFWFVGAFVAIDVLLLYGLIKLSYRDGRIEEVVELWPELLRITRTEPSGARKVWEANPHWVRISLHDTRRIEGYLVLSASGRDVELGAFLTPNERKELAQAIRDGLADAAHAVAVGRDG